MDGGTLITCKTVENKRRGKKTHFKHPSKSFINFRILLNSQGNIYPSKSNLLKGMSLLMYLHIVLIIKKY